MPGTAEVRKRVVKRKRKHCEQLGVIGKRVVSLVEEGVYLG